MIKVTLLPLEESDREQFILDNQAAFLYGAVEEFGMRDDHFEEDGEIISRQTIEESIDSDGAHTYRIFCDGKVCGGVVVQIDEETNRNSLDLLFVSPDAHGLGIGYSAWCEIEKMFPQTKVWETHTPHFEKRNIHFYVNKCGFHIVEFYNEKHPDPHSPEGEEEDGFFRFEKQMV